MESEARLEKATNDPLAWLRKTQWTAVLRNQAWLSSLVSLIGRHSPMLLHAPDEAGRQRSPAPLPRGDPLLLLHAGDLLLLHAPDELGRRRSAAASGPPHSSSLPAGARPSIPPPRPLLTARPRPPELEQTCWPRHACARPPHGATLLICSHSHLCGAISVRAPISATPSPSTAPLLL